MTNKTIKFDNPIEVRGTLVGEVELREPTGANFLDFGEPRFYPRTADGAVFAVEDKAAIQSYFDACIVHPLGSDLLRLLTVRDVRRVKSALFSVFGGETAI